MSASSAVTLDAPSGVPSTVAIAKPSSHFWQRLRQSFTTGVCSRSLSSESKSGERRAQPLERLPAQLDLHDGAYPTRCQRSNKAPPRYQRPCTSFMNA